MNEVQIMKQVPLVTFDRVSRRKTEISLQVKQSLAAAKLAMDQAKRDLELARNTSNHQRSKVTVFGFTQAFAVSDLEAVNDLISGDDIHGRGPVEAVISPDLMQVAAAAIQFTRKQRATFECISEDLVRVTSKGYGEV